MLSRHVYHDICLQKFEKKDEKCEADFITKFNWFVLVYTIFY